MAAGWNQRQDGGSGARLVFEDDPVARVRWEAMTRKIYFDELPRITRAHREFAAAVTARAARRTVCRGADQAAFG